MIKCNVCKELKDHCAKNMCHKCYRKIHNKKPEQRLRNLKRHYEWKKENKIRYYKSMIKHYKKKIKEIEDEEKKKQQKKDNKQKSNTKKNNRK